MKLSEIKRLTLDGMTEEKKKELKNTVVYVENFLGHTKRTTAYHYLILKKNNRLELVEAPKTEKKAKAEKKVEKKEEATEE